MSSPVQAGVSPAKTMTDLIGGMCVSRCISVAAELAVADLLAEGPKEVAVLARSIGAHPDALHRILRTLAGAGVFAELPDGRFSNTPLSATLIDGAQGAVRHYARLFGGELHWRMWSGLDGSVRTGRPWAENTYPDKTPFQVLAEQPADQAVFNAAMAELSAADGPAIAHAYDFSQFGRIVDVGGGHGTLARLIAAKAPAAKVTVFDLPHVIEGATERLGDECSMRVDFQGGSFFDSIPRADLCVLKHILHDWNDEDARRILTNCRNALNHGGRVLVCEMVVGPGPDGLAALIMDIEMLVGAGGRERTLSEFADLFVEAGLRLERVIGTQGPIQLLEAARVN